MGVKGYQARIDDKIENWNSSSYFWLKSKQTCRKEPLQWGPNFGSFKGPLNTETAHLSLDSHWLSAVAVFSPSALPTSATARGNKSLSGCARQPDKQNDRQTGMQTDARHPRIVSVSLVTSPPLSPCAVWRCWPVVEPLAASCWRSAWLFQYYWGDHWRVRTADIHCPGKCLCVE